MHEVFVMAPFGQLEASDTEGMHWQAVLIGQIGIWQRLLSMGVTVVGRDRARCRVVRFSVPPVVTVREICHLIRLPHGDRVSSFARDRNICAGVGGWPTRPPLPDARRMARLNVIEVKSCPRDPAATPRATTMITRIDHFAQVGIWPWRSGGNRAGERATRSISKI